MVKRSRLVRITVKKELDGDGVGCDEKVTKTLASESEMSSKEDASHPDIPFPQLDLLNIPEIVEGILKKLSKKEFGKCRLVNSLWNEEVCRFLRKSLQVNLCDRNLAYFERLLRTNIKLRLPNPFKHYKLTIKKLDDRNLARILNCNPWADVISCSVVVSQTATNSYYQKKLISLLEKNNTCLESLTFNMYRGIYLGYAATQDKIPILPKLRQMAINNKARGIAIPAESIQFIIDIINSAPALENLGITCDQEDVLLQIVNGGTFKSLDSFYAEGLTTCQIEALSNANFPKLTKLHLKYNDVALQEDSLNPKKVMQLITNFSTTIQDMSVSWIGNQTQNRFQGDFPMCPHLKTLTLYLYEGTLAAINPLTLPSLQTFSLVEYVEFQDSVPVPHEGVNTFSMEDFSGVYVDEEFDMLINYVDKQFPKLTNLSIYMVLNDCSIRTIVTALPLLAKLQLRVGPLVTEEAFTGVPLGINIDRYLSDGIELKEIRVLPSLANMRYLTDLDVSNFPAGPMITNTAIKHGIGMMLSLECLTMNWDATLSVQVIAKSLGHLKCLRLSDWHHTHPSNSIFELKKIMPQLEMPGLLD